MFFPKEHDLEKLMEQFESETKRLFFEQFESLNANLKLDDILFDSGNRFIEQRYGKIEFDSNGYDTISLCKFIHEHLKLEIT